jgi:biotin carboxylase
VERLLILNGSFCEQPVITKAKEMGYYVITTGNAPDLMGHAYADEYIPADYSDKEAILQLVKEHNIDKIVSCANDFGVLTAAYVAEKMGWKGHDTYENAVLLHHKDKFKDYCYTHNIPSPHSVVFTNMNDALEHVKTAEYPIIVKANDLTGGKGIRKAENYSDAVEALKYSFERSRDKHIVVEPFLEGTQHTIVTFIADKKIISSVSCNCYSPINPYLIQSETFPADNIDDVRDELHGIIENIVNDLDLVDGIFALQYFLCNGKPYIIEMMRRSFGNQFLTLADAYSGFPWEEAYIRAATGQSCADIKCGEPTAKFCGHHGIMAGKNGIIKSYTIPEEIQKHIFKKIDMLSVGQRIEDYMNERIAYLYYSYDNRDDMNEAVKQYNDMIKIELGD